MNQPTISIIIPVHNVEQYLDRCIRSVVCQTYSDLDIILIDDGSTDSSGDICDGWKDMDERIRVVHRPNEGLSSTRNIGLRMSSDDIIAFVDSDDWIEPEMYETMLRCMQKDQSDIVVCAYRSVNEKSDVVGVSAVPEEIMDTREALSELIRQKSVKLTVWNKLYRKAVVEDVRFEPGKAFEDVYWSCQAISNAKRISLMSDVFYNHYIREGSITHTSYSARNLDALDGYRQCCELIKERFPELYDDVLLAYMGYCMNHMQNALRTCTERDVLDNIKSRLPYRKTGHPTKKLCLRNKLLYSFFWYFPVTTARLLISFIAE